MALSRSQLMKELLPGLNQMFGMEYSREIGELAFAKQKHGSDYEVFRWDGKKWVTISEPMSLEEAEALVKASE